MILMVAYVLINKLMKVLKEIKLKTYFEKISNDMFSNKDQSSIRKRLFGIVTLRL